MAFGDSELGDSGYSLFTFVNCVSFILRLHLLLRIDYVVMIFILYHRSATRLSKSESQKNFFVEADVKTSNGITTDAACAVEINNKRRKRVSDDFCLPFGGFCGFPFHLENILNDTHLLNMLSFSLPFRTERRRTGERDEERKIVKCSLVWVINWWCNYRASSSNGSERGKCLHVIIIMLRFSHI